MPDPDDAAELTALLRRHEAFGRGWAGASEEDLLVDISPQDDVTRENVVLRGPQGTIIGWSSAHDRAAGRMLLVTVVDRDLDDETADRVAGLLFSWAERVAEVVGRRRGLDVQQIDSGAFADDDRQHRWLERAGFAHVRTWWQMTRPVEPDEAGLDAGPGQGSGSGPWSGRAPGCRTRTTCARSTRSSRAPSPTTSTPTRRPSTSSSRGCARTPATGGTTGGSPSSSTTTRAGAGRRPGGRRLAGLGGDAPAGSYVEYIGVLQNARGRGVAKSLLKTVIADAASRGRDRVGLEVDADSPTGADGLYVSMGWTTEATSPSRGTGTSRSNLYQDGSLSRRPPLRMFSRRLDANPFHACPARACLEPRRRLLKRPNGRNHGPRAPAAAPAAAPAPAAPPQVTLLEGLLRGEDLSTAVLDPGPRVGRRRATWSRRSASPSRCAATPQSREPR